MSDLNQCCTRSGRFWEDPSQFTKEFQGLTLSFDFIWKDLNIVLSHCCTTEEKTRIWAQAETYVDGLHVVQPQQYPVGMMAVPLMDPNWDYKPGQAGITRRDHMTLCLIEGMKRCIIKPVNYDKVKEITQGQDENPALLQDRLVDAPRKYTNVDPYTFEEHIVFATHFISQSAPEIHWKLQKLAMGPQTPLNLVTDTAFSVFNNRHQAEQERKEQRDLRKEQQQARLLAAVMTRPPGHPKSTPRRPPRQEREPVLAVGAPNTRARNALETRPSLHPRRHAHSVRRCTSGGGNCPQL